MTDRSSEPSQSRRYATPRLIKLGKMLVVTQSGTSGRVENMGNDVMPTWQRP